MQHANLISLQLIQTIQTNFTGWMSWRVVLWSEKTSMEIDIMRIICIL